jgi:hypothetical protein
MQQVSRLFFYLFDIFIRRDSIRSSREGNFCVLSNPDIPCGLFDVGGFCFMAD